MTHLYIELNTGLTEEVDNKVIEKLYKTVTENTLDETSDLKGRLHASAAYISHLNYLNDNFDELIINTDERYIDFVSKDIELNLATEYGDGIGVYYSNRTNVIGFLGRTHTETMNGRTFNFNYNDGRCAFANDKNLTSVNELSLFPNLKSIPEAFFAYSSLSSIDLSNIETLGSMSFCFCLLSGIINAPKLKSLLNRTINIPYFHEDGSQFRGNIGITEINIGSDVPEGNKIKIIPASCMRAIDNLTKVTGLSEVTKLTYHAFSYTPSLYSIDTTDALTTIESNVFSHSSIKCLNLLNVTLIGLNAFEACTHLLNIYTSDPTLMDPDVEDLDISLPNLTSIGSSAFRGCTLIKTVSNLGSIEVLPSFAFYECTNLTSVVFPSTLKELLATAFNSTPMKTIIGPEGIEIMVFGLYVTANRAFDYIEVPSTVVDMKQFFHRSLEGYGGRLDAICVIKAINPPALAYHVTGSSILDYDGTNDKAEKNLTNSGAGKFLGIYVPDASLSAYQAATGPWQESNILARLKPISQLQTDSPTYWAVYQSGLSNNS